jgi:hypothetical protein
MYVSTEKSDDRHCMRAVTSFEDESSAVDLPYMTIIWATTVSEHHAYQASVSVYLLCGCVLLAAE